MTDDEMVELEKRLKTIERDPDSVPMYHLDYHKVIRTLIGIIRMLKASR